MFVIFVLFPFLSVFFSLEKTEVSAENLKVKGEGKRKIKDKRKNSKHIQPFTMMSKQKKKANFAQFEHSHRVQGTIPNAVRRFQNLEYKYQFELTSALFFIIIIKSAWADELASPESIHCGPRKKLPQDQTSA